MKKQITHISIHQSSKVIAFLLFFFTALILIPVAVIAYLFTGELSSFALLLAPFVYLIVAYIAYAIMFWGYNIVASTFGGIEFDLQDKA